MCLIVYKSLFRVIIVKLTCKLDLHIQRKKIWHQQSLPNVWNVWVWPTKLLKDVVTITIDPILRIMIVKVRVTLSNRIAKVTGILGIQAQMKKFTEGCYNPYNQVDNVWFDNYQHNNLCFCFYLYQRENLKN